MRIQRSCIALLALLATLVFGQIACAPAQATPVPPELIGVWETDNEKYFDRFFTIRGTTITFGTGEGTSETYLITRVERIPFVGDNLYTVEYTNPEGDPYRFSFFFFGGGEQHQIRLKNQRYIVWMRSR